MKALKNHIILFDAECPMCQMYTEAFVKTGMLDSDGRAAYQNMPEMACPLIDKQRAADEIALVNTQTGEVSYGVQSLFKVLGNSMPVFKPLFDWSLFGWLMSKVYALVSFNRRVIVPTSPGAVKNEFQPSFRLKYRLIYLAITWLLTGFILSKFSILIKDLVMPGQWHREYLICGGQILFQGLVTLALQREKTWEYLGNMMTISMAGAFLLLPMIAINSFAIIPPIANAIYFIVVAGLMFAEHIRRVKLIQVSGALSITWVLYRLLLLALLV